MATELVRNGWGIILHHRDGNVLELRWLPTTMTDGAFMATLCLFAAEAEKARPRGLLIDAVEFRHRFGDGVMAWRDAHIIPRYADDPRPGWPFPFPENDPEPIAESVLRADVEALRKLVRT